MKCTRCLLFRSFAFLLLCYLWLWFEMVVPWSFFKQFFQVFPLDLEVPRIVKKIYLKYLYKFETLVSFKVLHLWLNAMIAEPLPLLETLPKIFNGNAVKSLQRFLLKLCKVSKTRHFWFKTKWWLCPLLVLAIFVLSQATNEDLKEAFYWRCRGSTRIADSSWQNFRWRF